MSFSVTSRSPVTFGSFSLSSTKPTWAVLERETLDLIKTLSSLFDVAAVPQLIEEANIMIHSLRNYKGSDAPSESLDAYKQAFSHLIESMKVKELSIRLYDRNSPSTLPVDLLLVSKDLQTGHEFITSKHLLGEGCFGKVYETHLNDRSIAEKTIIPGYDTPFHDPEKLKREGALLMALSHRNIVAVLGFTEEPRVALMLEYVNRGSLYDNLSNRDLYDHRTVCQILSGIADGLCYIHARNLTHCDLHWGNVGLTQTDQGLVPKILDFELASLQTPLSASDGNLLIQSPEAMRRNDEMHFHACKNLRFQHTFSHTSISSDGKKCYFYRDLTNKTDIWSFGILASSLLLGGKSLYECMQIRMRNCLLRSIKFSNLNYLNKVLARPRQYTTLGIDPKILLSRRLLQEVIHPCFARNPTERPSAEALHNVLIQMTCMQELKKTFQPINPLS